MTWAYPTWCDRFRPLVKAYLDECGRSAVGSAEPCQGSGRGFDPRRPLDELRLEIKTKVEIWWSGREARLGTANPATRVQIPSPPRKILKLHN